MIIYLAPRLLSGSSGTSPMLRIGSTKHEFRSSKINFGFRHSDFEFPVRSTGDSALHSGKDLAVSFPGLLRELGPHRSSRSFAGRPLAFARGRFCSHLACCHGRSLTCTLLPTLQAKLASVRTFLPKTLASECSGNHLAPSRGYYTTGGLKIKPRRASTIIINASRRFDFVSLIVRPWVLTPEISSTQPIYHLPFLL